MAAAALLAVWVLADLLRPVALHLRRFDPHEVARLETGMWRAYYEHRPVALFGILTELLRSQYGLPFWRSVRGAFHAARAARTFQRGTSRSGYELALPDLRSFYAEIGDGADVRFDVGRVAVRELEWWISHRNKVPDLALRLAELQGEMYSLPADRFRWHADARAQAMALRDARGSAITQSDWDEIEKLLRLSWSEHLSVVRGPGNPDQATSPVR